MLGWLIDEIFAGKGGTPAWVLLILLGICAVIGIPLGLAFGAGITMGFISNFGPLAGP